MSRAHLWLASLLLVASVARAQLPSEPVGQVVELPSSPGAHWIWIGDLLLQRSALVDADSGAFLGTLSAGLGILSPSFSADGREIYLVETHYSRGTRGERTDLVTVYDATTLNPEAEIVIPAKRAEHVSGVAGSALSDDGRFLAVFNLTPATSLSIVDLDERRFAGEIGTPGCSLVYPAGERRFAMLCGDGALLTVTLDEAGRALDRVRSEPFFDAANDPVTEKPARDGDRWLFVSFEGHVHAVDLSGEGARFEEPWSLLDDADRRDGWRIGGIQHVTVHEGTRRLYSLVHRGGIDTYKDPGTEIWTYDLETRARLGRIQLRSPLGVFIAQQLELDGEGLGSRFADWLLQTLLPNPGVDRIEVTQDESPVLIAASSFPASVVSVYDALSGEFLRDLEEVGLAGGRLQVP